MDMLQKKCYGLYAHLLVQFFKNSFVCSYRAMYEHYKWLIFSHNMLPRTLFVPSFEGHKKPVIKIVVKLSVLNGGEKKFGGGIVITKVQQTHVYTHDIQRPFRIYKRAVSKVTAGWRHTYSGVTLDIWNIHQKCILLIAKIQALFYSLFKVQKSKMDSVVFLHCVCVRANVQTCMRIRNDVCIPRLHPKFSKCTHGTLNFLCSKYCIEVYNEKI